MKAVSAGTSVPRHFAGAAAEAFLIAAIVAALLLAAASVTGNAPGGAASVLAAKGGAASGSSSIELVTLPGGASVAEVAGPSHGDAVTFSVATTATSRPYVLLNCYQDGTWVYAAQAGFWADYPWGQNFTLASTSWTGGAASCTARLGSLNADGTKFRELARTTFGVSG